MNKSKTKQIEQVKKEFRQFIKHWFLLERESISSQAKEELDRLIDQLVSQSEQRGEKRERERVGKELWKWFYGTDYEDIEEATERITGVKDPRNK